MDGFYLAFVGVGAGLFCVSWHRKEETPAGVQIAWVLLGLSLCCSVVMFGTLARDQERFQPLVICEVIRHLFLGAAVICLGVSFATGHRKRSDSDIEVINTDDALEALEQRGDLFGRRWDHIEHDVHESVAFLTNSRVEVVGNMKIP